MEDRDEMSSQVPHSQINPLNENFALNIFETLIDQINEMMNE